MKAKTLVYLARNSLGLGVQMSHCTPSGYATDRKSYDKKHYDMYSLLFRYSSKLGDQNPEKKSQTSPKINKFPSTEEILCATGFYKLPGLPQRSQI
jgi:hypothetical protein